MNFYPATLLLTSGPINVELDVKGLVHMEQVCSDCLNRKSRYNIEENKRYDSSFAESLVVDNKHIQFDLSAFVGTIYPDGFLPLIHTRGEVDYAAIEKRMWSGGRTPAIKKYAPINPLNRPDLIN